MPYNPMMVGSVVFGPAERGRIKQDPERVRELRGQGLGLNEAQDIEALKVVLRTMLGS